MQLFRYGQWLHRNETWGEYAWTLTNYLARSSAMLQQGHSVADILLYYGEDINVTAIYGGDTFSTLPDVPDGDFVAVGHVADDADVILVALFIVDNDLGAVGHALGENRRDVIQIVDP